MILNMPLPENRSTAAMSEAGNCYIGMDTGEWTSREERVHLAHELGHCETGAFYNVYAKCDIRRKYERRADKWAIRQLIPKRAWNAALRDGIVEVWDLAEYFDVTEDYVRKAHELYSAS